jgi:hypothetical protein
LSGSSGRSRSNWASLNQNSLKSTLPQSQGMNHIETTKGITFMGPDPKLGSDRLSKPFFDIDVVRSLFRWAPDDWAVIYVAPDKLDGLLASIGEGTPRKEMTYKWDEVASIAWKAALDAPPPRRRAALITQIQLEYSEVHACEPGEKEVGRLLDDALDHVGDRVLSREVSSE